MTCDALSHQYACSINFKFYVYSSQNFNRIPPFMHKKTNFRGIYHTSIPIISHTPTSHRFYSLLFPKNTKYFFYPIPRKCLSTFHTHFYVLGVDFIAFVFHNPRRKPMTCVFLFFGGSPLDEIDHPKIKRHLLRPRRANRRNAHLP